MAYFSRMLEEFADPLFVAALRHIADWIVFGVVFSILAASIIRSNQPSAYRREAEELNASIRGLLQVFTGIASRR